MQAIPAIIITICFTDSLKGTKYFTEENNIFRNLGTVRVHNGKLQHTVLQGLFKDHIKFSRTTYQEYNNPQRVYKCTFPVYSNKPLRLELFASPTSLHFSVHLS